MRPENDHFDTPFAGAAWRLRLPLPSTREEGRAMHAAVAAYDAAIVSSAPDDAADLARRTYDRALLLQQVNAHERKLDRRSA